MSIYCVIWLLSLYLALPNFHTYGHCYNTKYGIWYHRTHAHTIKLSHLQVDFCCYPESFLHQDANFVVSDLKFCKGKTAVSISEGYFFSRTPSPARKTHLKSENLAIKLNYQKTKCTFKKIKPPENKEAEFPGQKINFFWAQLVAKYWPTKIYFLYIWKGTI